MAAADGVGAGAGTRLTGVQVIGAGRALWPHGGLAPHAACVRRASGALSPLLQNTRTSSSAPVRELGLACFQVEM